MIRRLWPLILGAFALGLYAYVLAGLLPGMARDLRTTPALVGLGVALFTAAYAVSAPALAFVAGRTSTRAALLIGVALFTSGNVATMLAPSLNVMLAARLLAGIGAGLYSPLAASSASGMAASHERGTALAAVLAGLSTGTALGVPVGLLLEDHYGWRSTIGLIVALGLVAMVGIAAPRIRLPPAAPLAWQQRLDALRAPFTLKTLAVTFGTGAASLGLYTYLAEVTAARGLGASTHLFIWLWGLGGMAGALLIGRAIDGRLPAYRATPVLLLGLGIALLLFGWGGTFVAGIGCFLWGLTGWASVAPQQHALIAHDLQHATASIAWNSSLNYLGGAIGAAAGSAVLSAHLPASWLAPAAMMVVVIAVAVHFSK